MNFSFKKDGIESPESSGKIILWLIFHLPKLNCRNKQSLQSICSTIWVCWWKIISLGVYSQRILKMLDQWFLVSDQTLSKNGAFDLEKLIYLTFVRNHFTNNKQNKHLFLYMAIGHSMYSFVTIQIMFISSGSLALHNNWKCIHTNIF